MLPLIKNSNRIHQLPSQILDRLLQLSPSSILPCTIIDLFLNQDAMISQFIFDDILGAQHESVWKHLASSSVSFNTITILSINHLQIRTNLIINVVSKLPHLRHFSSRANAKLSDNVILALNRHCPLLEYLNINVTSCSISCLKNILGMPRIATIKMASIDLCAPSKVRDIVMNMHQKLLSLVNLKLRASSVREIRLLLN